jgi:dienelactone hydrolase
MIMKFLSFVFVSLFLVSEVAQAATHTPGRNIVMVRGQAQAIYFYPAVGAPHGSVLFVPGDGGWRGFAVDVAQVVSKAGYDVYGLDDNVYLESFTGKTALSATDVMHDFQDIAAWIAQGRTSKISLVGWSEGAGLCLLGAASPEGKSLFSGLITMGLPENNVLGWRTVDDLTWLTKKTPNEPLFRSMDYIRQVTPLRLWMLQSTTDEYVPLDKSRELFAAAAEPKKFSAIDATSHRFDGNQKELYRLIEEGLQWLNG